MRILVADDDADLGDLLRINLEAEGHEVQLAADGTEALALAMTCCPDLIVLDIMMPGLDGLEVLRSLREQPGKADLLIVLLSARGSDREVLEGWSSGADYYLTKPYELDELLHFIRQVRARSQLAPGQGRDLDLVFDLGGGYDVPPRLVLPTAEDHRQLEIDLHAALGAGQFFLVYQPSFDLSEVGVTGVEALIRWRHPTLGTVQPADFIPLLERTGLMAPVSRWVLKHACRQAVTWREQGCQLSIAVNLSVGLLKTPELLADLAVALAASGLDPGSLVIDIPETALMGDMAESVRRLFALRRLGLRVAIDDFGVSDLPASVLSQLPVDILKIHRSFTSGITTSAESAAPMRALLEIGRSFGLETMAKGIEKQEQLLRLQREQCDAGQGFLFAPSMDVEAVGPLLKTWGIRRVVLASQAGAGL